MVKRRINYRANISKLRRCEPTDDRIGDGRENKPLIEEALTITRSKLVSKGSDSSIISSESGTGRSLSSSSKSASPGKSTSKLPTISSLLSHPSLTSFPTSQNQLNKSATKHFFDQASEANYHESSLKSANIISPSNVRLLLSNPPSKSHKYHHSLDNLPSHEGKDLLSILTCARELADRYLINSDSNKSFWQKNMEKSPLKKIQPSPNGKGSLPGFDSLLAAL